MLSSSEPRFLPSQPSASPAAEQSPRKRHPRFIFTQKSPFNIRDVASSVANGMDAESIDPALFPSLVPELQVLLDEMKASNNTASVKAIMKALTFISEYRPTELQDNTKPKEKRPQTPQEDISPYVKAALENKDLPYCSPKKRGVIVQKLREIQASAVREKNYEMAAKANTAARRVSTEWVQQKAEMVTSKKQAELQHRYEELRDTLVAMKAHWQMQLESMNRQRDQEMGGLAAYLEDEVKRFDEAVSDGPKRGYWYASPRLLEYRTLEQRLTSSNRFDDAIKIKDEADKLEAREKAEAAERWYVEQEAKRKELIKSLREKHEARNAMWGRAIQKQSNRARFELDSLEKSLAHLGSQINDDGSQRGLNYPSTPRLPKLSLSKSKPMTLSGPITVRRSLDSLMRS